MDNHEAIDIARRAIGYLLKEFKVLPGEFNRKEIKAAAAQLESLKVELDPVRRQRILEMLEMMDARRAGEIPPDWLEFFDRI